MVKNLPANAETKETQVRSLGRKDSLEKGMVTYSSILAWRIPWTEEPGGYSPQGRKKTQLKQLSRRVSILIAIC